MEFNERKGLFCRVDERRNKLGSAPHPKKQMHFVTDRAFPFDFSWKVKFNKRKRSFRHRNDGICFRKWNLPSKMKFNGNFKGKDHFRDDRICPQK